MRILLVSFLIFMSSQLRAQYSSEQIVDYFVEKACVFKSDLVKTAVRAKVESYIQETIADHECDSKPLNECTYLIFKKIKSYDNANCDVNKISHDSHSKLEMTQVDFLYGSKKSDSNNPQTIDIGTGKCKIDESQSVDTIASGQEAVSVVTVSVQNKKIAACKYMFKGCQDLNSFRYKNGAFSADAFSGKIKDLTLYCEAELNEKKHYSCKNVNPTMSEGCSLLQYRINDNGSINTPYSYKVSDRLKEEVNDQVQKSIDKTKVERAR